MISFANWKFWKQKDNLSQLFWYIGQRERDKDCPQLTAQDVTVKNFDMKVYLLLQLTAVRCFVASHIY